MKFIKNEAERDRANFLMQLAIAAAVIGVNLAILYIISNVTIPQKNEAAFNIFLGNALGWISALIAFCFPSSMGSAKKDETISKLADKAAPPTVDPAEITPKEMINGREDGTRTTGVNAADQSELGTSGTDPSPIPAIEDIDGDGFPDHPPTFDGSIGMG